MTAPASAAGGPAAHEQRALREVAYGERGGRHPTGRGQPGSGLG